MKSVSQKHNFGCGAACAAFVLRKNYSEIVSILGKTKAGSKGFTCRDLATMLLKFGLVYSYCYLKLKLKRKIYRNGVIVFIKRSREYPIGHYLTWYHGLWMDPWINFRSNTNIKYAKSGFRKRLPDTPIYGLFPSDSKF